MYYININVSAIQTKIKSLQKCFDQLASTSSSIKFICALSPPQADITELFFFFFCKHYMYGKPLAPKHTKKGS